jgi:hypothetical protein
VGTMRERQREVQLYRGQVPSPGRPTVAWREDRVRFWAAIARGIKTEDAAVEAGVSSPVAFRWFRHAGGVNPCLPAAVSGRYLSFCEREDIVRTSRSSVRRVLACGQSPAGWDAARRRSRGSCAGMPRRGRGGWNTRRRSRSGTLNVGPVGRRRPRWRRTTGSVSTCRTGSPVSCGRWTGASSGRPGGVERQEQAAPWRPPVGARMEPGADRQPAAGGLPR